MVQGAKRKERQKDEELLSHKNSEMTRERETRRKVNESEEAEEESAMMRTLLLTLLWSVVAPSLPFDAVILAKVVEEARTCWDVLVERKRLRDSTRDKWAERVCFSSVVEEEEEEEEEEDEVELEEEEEEDEMEDDEEEEEDEGRRQGPLKGATRETRVEVVMMRISSMMRSVASEVMMTVTSTAPTRFMSAFPLSMMKGTRTWSKEPDSVAAKVVLKAEKPPLAEWTRTLRPAMWSELTRKRKPSAAPR